MKKLKYKEIYNSTNIKSQKSEFLKNNLKLKNQNFKPIKFKEN